MKQVLAKARQNKNITQRRLQIKLCWAKRDQSWTPVGRCKGRFAKSFSDVSCSLQWQILHCWACHRAWLSLFCWWNWIAPAVCTCPSLHWPRFLSCRLLEQPSHTSLLSPLEIKRQNFLLWNGRCTCWPEGVRLSSISAPLWAHYDLSSLSSWSGRGQWRECRKG